MDPSPVLYAEDEENDVFLMQRAFKKAGVTNPLRTVADGAQAIRYLQGDGEYADRARHPLPCLLLLDLNLPRKTGLEVLKWTRAQPAFRTLPIIFLTSSNQDRDIGSAYQLGANGYLVKPAGPERLLELVVSLRDSCLLADMKLGPRYAELKGNIRPPPSLEPSR
jgi:CheY-like chemotaxis protein